MAYSLGQGPIDRPFFSIIIPTMHCGEALAQTLASVVEEDAEIVVVDGGCDEETLEILHHSGDRVRWISEPDEGVYHAMNKGVNAARGRYLLFLGAGDRLRSGVLEKVAQVAPAHDVAFIYGNALMHDKGVVWDGAWEPTKFRKRNICHQAIFHGRGIFQRLGGFETRFRVLADYAMNIRCFGDPRIEKIFIDEVIADYVGNGFSANTRDEIFYSERDAYLAKHLGLVKN